MTLRKYGRLFLAVLIGCAAIVFIAVLWLFLPSVDESVGFLTGRALRLGSTLNCIADDGDDNTRKSQSNGGG